ncbi:type VI secretion system tip protein VgrG [Haemophilus parainfluenzae]|uniref:Type VI secretion system tip protein VgrG n=2 Tax=Haemophilus parainfluenzae TaxID=729 RepID=A0A7M1P0D2_HAEPA|nr:type VI secretion system tip protein VgrG [Haemophilus parainfluenzae]
MGRQSGISPQGIVESGRGLSSPSMQNLSSSLPNLSSATLPTSDIPSSLSDGLSSISSLLNKSPSGLQFTLQAGNLPPNTFKVVSFEYREAYSTPFEINLLLSSPQSAVNFSDVLDNQATLSIWRNGELLRSVSGMVSSFEQGDSGFRQTFYRMEINPELWRLGLRRNSRIFQNESPIDILQSLLTENGVTQYRFDLRHEHPPREFCVQYRETDLAFLQRLSAEEGLTYYFEQDGGQTKLIFSDDAQTLNNGNAVSLPYNLNKKAQLQETVVTAFNRSERVRPSEVKLKDYTFKNPSWTAEFNKEAGDANNQRSGYEHYDYPGRFKDENQGKAFTQYRLESLRTDAHQGWGKSNSAQLSVGGLLQLTNHPNASLNTLWQISRIVYRGSQPQALEQEGGDKATTLENEFEFIPRHQSWRPMQLTKPRVEGPQIAIVVGPKDEEIYCDKFGRIKLQFLWDREGQYNDHSSCWIRVTQPWAGKNWGMIAIPRVGQEIVVDFLEGDPDQPIVTGRTYHATNMPPDALPAAKTQMNLMSQTYKGGGYNGLMMDDATNNQRLDLHAQKDMNTKVLNDQTSTIQNNRSITVVGGNETRTVQSGDLSESVKGNRNITVESGDQTRVIQSGNSSESVKGNRSILVEEGNQSLIVKTGDRGVEVQTGNDSLVVKAGHRSVEVTAGDDSKTIGAGNLYESVAETRATQAKAIQMVGSESIVLNVGAATLNMTTDAITISFGDGSGITIKASGVYAIAPEIHLNK